MFIFFKHLVFTIVFWLSVAYGGYHIYYNRPEYILQYLVLAYLVISFWFIGLTYVLLMRLVRQGKELRELRKITGKQQ